MSPVWAAPWSAAFAASRPLPTPPAGGLHSGYCTVPEWRTGRQSQSGARAVSPGVAHGPSVPDGERASGIPPAPRPGRAGGRPLRRYCLGSTHCDCALTCGCQASTGPWPLASSPRRRPAPGSSASRGAGLPCGPRLLSATFGWLARPVWAESQASPLVHLSTPTHSSGRGSA